MLGIFQIGRGLPSSAALGARGISSSQQTHQCSNKVQHGQYKGCSLLRIYLKIDSASILGERLYPKKKLKPRSEEQPAVITNIKTSSSAAPIASTALHILGHPHLPGAVSELIYRPCSLGFAPLDDTDPIPSANCCVN